ncbi:hypothetical protein AB0A69_28000 [Streptomyces sp. NPDC045431]|uniref:hypothetical protein n=1 Tax=Streptomyces sp. NPDC045431 TaxID=3155613 RepID=UPI0033D5F336
MSFVQGFVQGEKTRLPAVALLAAALVVGCGTGDTGGDGPVPEGWGTLKTRAVTVAHPPAFTPQGDAERSRHNAAAAVRTEGGKATGMLSVQLDFTNADSVEEAAIGAEAGIALGSTLGEQEEIEVAGPEGAREARRIAFAFTEKGTRYAGVIVAGLDAGKKAYAVRIDAAEGTLSDADVDRIVGSITVVG